MLHQICSQVGGIEIPSASDIAFVIPMPARISKITAATAPAPASTKATSAGLLARLLKAGPQVRRLAVWMGVSLAGTYAMGSAVNLIFSGGSNKSQDTRVNDVAQSQTPSPGNDGVWWNLAGTNSPASTDYSDSSSDADGGTSSSSISVVPTNTGIPTFSGTLTLTNQAPIDSNSSQQAYDVLGLRTSSTPLSMTTASMALASSGNASSPTLATFSLSGSMHLVPVNNLEAGGLNMTPAVAIPEPTTAVMVVTGLAGLGMTRRRQARRTV
jgi:hypothetical protein